MSANQPGHIRRLVAAPLLAAFLVTQLAACTAAQPEPAPASESQQTAEEPTKSPPPQYLPDGTAAENEKYFSYVLRKAIRAGVDINGVEMVNALVGGGFDRSMMQVSFDTTQTGLAADNIFVSVRRNDQCLLGQIITSDKTVHVDVQPAIGPEKTVCLIGETRPIDW